MQMLRMQRKRVLVTGSGTGLGREIALECAREGADVVLHDAHYPADSAKQEIEDLGRKVAVVHADLSDLEHTFHLADKALEAFGGLDCLVNNAGICLNRPFLENTPAEFEKIYNVNVRAPFFLTQKFASHIVGRQGAGTVCNIASIHGMSGAPEHAIYAGTKGAIISQTRTIGIEMAHKGVRVNAIAPGWVTVDSYHRALPGFNEEDARKAAAEKVPLGRSGHQVEIGKLAVFLCSEDSGYIVGQTIVADGGTTSLMSLISDFRTRSSAQFGRDYL
jgi:NAD(P)-dependent dehydrogenase (short-subunit alcohol dehydrogenase family)